jgi:hypothetical protein
VLGTTHDELMVLLADDEHAEWHVKNVLEAELAATPEWMPNIPLSAEGSWSKRYEK